MELDGKYLNWWWITDKYDVPLEGVVFQDGKYWRASRNCAPGNWISDDGEESLEEGEYDDSYTLTRIRFMMPWIIKRWIFFKITRPKLFRNLERVARETHPELRKEK